MTATFLLATWLTLSPAGDRVSVAWDFPGEVFHFDAKTGRPAGREFMRAAPPLAGRYRLDRFAGTLTFLAAPARTIPVCREPIAAAEAPGGRLLFVACHLPEQAATAARVAARIVVVDTASRTPAASILLPNGATGVKDIAVSPDGRWAFVTHILARYTVHTSQLEQGWMNTNAVSILDVRARKWHGAALLDDVDNGAANPWGVAVSADSKKLYVTHAGTHELSVIDVPAMLARIAAAGEESMDRLSFLIDIRQRIPLPGKGPRAVGVYGGKAWVAEYFTRSIAVVSENGAKKFASTPAPPPASGEMLFHDASLCFGRWQSCSSCHPGARVDGLNWDLLNDGLGNPKNTRTMLNAHETGAVMWTGVRPSASYAVRSGMKHILFTDPAEPEARAIEAWLRSMKPVRLPVTDRAAVERGRAIFKTAGCDTCHPQPFYTDNQLHDVDTHGPADFSDGKPQREFKTPSLIEIWRTGPYLHDGRYATLEEAVHSRNPGLTAAQIKDLIAFLRSL